MRFFTSDFFSLSFWSNSLKNKRSPLASSLMPERMFKSVVFPAPFSPIRAVAKPFEMFNCGMFNSKFLSRFWIFLHSIIFSVFINSFSIFIALFYCYKFSFISSRVLNMFFNSLALSPAILENSIASFSASSTFLRCCSLIISLSWAFT